MLIAVHGGAGTWPDASHERAVAGVARAVEAGHAVLAGGGDALAAVQAAVVVLEDDPVFNAGRGAALDVDGGITLDASVMRGSDRAAGAVAALRGIRNPVLAARAVLDSRRHVMLVGDPAAAFAREAGLETRPEDWFETPDRRSAYHAGDSSRGGTVGAVARDAQGGVAAATSTGGMSGKHLGRVGDSPLIGAGTWADDATVAVSCTGDGEAIIRCALAHEVDALMRHGGLSLQEACSRALEALGPLRRHRRPDRRRRRGRRGRAVHDERDAARVARGRRRADRTPAMSADDLYALPLEDFTARRDLAARELRKSGDREGAGALAKLPKPTPAAWTANQIAREQPELMEALLAAGEELRAAQEAAMSGGGAGGLRDAMAAQRKAVDAVMTAAAEYRPAGRALSRAMADRLRTTLQAAAGDEDLSAALAAGRLVDEAAAGGAWAFGAELTAVEAPAKQAEKGGGAKARAPAKPRGGRRAKTPRDDDAAAAAAAREAEEAAARERKALREELKSARATLRVRERSATSAQREADAAREAAEDAAARLAAAQQQAEEAKADAAAAERAAGEAAGSLQAARDDVARLEERLD